MKARCSLHREFRPSEDQGCEARAEAARNPFLRSFRVERKIRKQKAKKLRRKPAPIPSDSIA